MDTPGDLLLYGVVGSTAYGLATDGSDVDRLGVYIAPTAKVLGLDASAVTEHSVVDHDPDCVAHELGKFVRLAMVANPTIIELLYLPRYEIRTELGERLLALRSSFLCEHHVRNAYAGYAHQQVERLLRRTADGKEGFSSDTSGRTAKHARHCIRLLLQGGQLLRSGTLELDVSEHREELFAAGELAAINSAAFETLYRQHRARFDATTSVLPEHVDRSHIEQFLVQARLDAL